MDKIIEQSNSLVILGSNHNPTVLLGDFLTESGIIKSSEQIDLEQSVLTPSFGSIAIKNGSIIQINENKFQVDGSFNSSPYTIGERYCKNLPHIPYNAIGINLVYNIEGIEIQDLIPECKIKSYGLKELKTSFKHELGICNVAVKNIEEDKKKIELKFNFDYQVPDDKVHKLGNLHIDLLDEWEEDQELAINFINEITQ